MLSFLQSAAVCALVPYLAQRWAYMRRRNRQSWESLISRLRSDSAAFDISDPASWLEGLARDTDWALRRNHDARSIWALFSKARVLMEIADCAERNGAVGTAPTRRMDPIILASLRSDAMQIRVSAVIAIAWAALHKPHA